MGIAYNKNSHHQRHRYYHLSPLAQFVERIYPQNVLCPYKLGRAAKVSVQQRFTTQLR